MFEEISEHEIVHHMPGAVFQLLVHANGDFKFPFLSKGFERITGIPCEQITANPDTVFCSVYKQDQDPLRQCLFTHAELPKSSTVEFRMHTAKGELKWFQIRAQSSLLENGAVLKHGIMLDITEQKLAEQQLHANQEQLESDLAERTAQVKEQASIIDQMHEAVISTDMEGFVTSWNWGAQQIFGYSAKEAIGRSLLIIYPDQHPHGAFAELLEPVRSEGIHNVDKTLSRKDGSNFYSRMSLSILRNNAGCNTGIIAYIADITEQRQVQNALRKKQAETVALLNAVPDSMFQLNRQGDILSSHASNTSTAPKHIDNVFPQAINLQILSYVEKVLDSNQTATLEYGTLNRSGVHQEYEARFAPISTDEVVMLTRDITERIQAESAIQTSRRYFQSLDRLARVLGTSTDLESTLSQAMQELLEIFNVERAWLLYPLDPKANHFQIPVEATHPDYLGLFKIKTDIPMNDQMRQIARQALSTPAPIVHDFSSPGGNAANQEQATQTQMVIAIYPRDGKPWLLGLHQCRQNRGWSNNEHRLFSDIALRISDTLSSRLLLQRLEEELNKRVKTEQELIVAKTKAEEASKAKSQFLSSMSHELRTPMNAILGFAQLLILEDIDQEHKELANEIIVAGNHLMALINDILDMEKIELGTITINKEYLSLRHVVQECEQLISPMIAARNVRFNISKDSQINVSIYTDRTRLKQVLLNLLSNAIKYNKPKGEVTLSCRKMGNILYMAVADTGYGISEEKQRELFTAFERFGAEKTNIEGTGIGLVITKSLTELMGGSITVDSKKGQGSTFFIELPVTAPVDEYTEIDKLYTFDKAEQE